MKTSKLFCPAVLAAVLTLTGCVDPFPSTDVIYTKDVDPKMIEISPSLKEKLKLIQVFKSKMESKVTKYSFTFRVMRVDGWDFVFHCYKKPRIAYRFVWYDAKGKEVLPDIDDLPDYKWYTAEIKPGGLFSCSTIGYNTNVVKAKVIIKLADELSDADKKLHKAVQEKVLKNAAKSQKKAPTSVKDMMKDKPDVPKDEPKNVQPLSLSPQERKSAPVAKDRKNISISAPEGTKK